MAGIRKRSQASPTAPPVVVEQLHQLQVWVPRKRAGALEPLLWQLFPSGFEERAEGKSVCFVSYASSAAELRALVRRVKPALQAVQGVSVRSGSEASDWQTRWIAELGPQRLTRSMRVVPVALARPKRARAGDIFLLQRAAFGFGEHPTTRLMAGEVERVLRRDSPQSVLDVGTGTGVLALVAARCGAHPILGIDIDSESVRAARANAKINGFTTQCAFREQPIAQVRRSFDLVLANLDVPTLSRLARSLRRTVAPQGLLLVSGVLVEAEAAVTDVFARQGFTQRSRRREGEWVVLGYRR